MSWQERLWPSVWLAPVVLLLGTGFGLVTAPFGGAVAVPVAVLATVVLGGMLLADHLDRGGGGRHVQGGPGPDTGAAAR